MIEFLEAAGWFFSGVGAVALTIPLVIPEPVSKNDIVMLCGIPGVVGVLLLIMVTV
jgi:hypothetical protein